VIEFETNDLQVSFSMHRSLAQFSSHHRTLLRYLVCHLFSARFQLLFCVLPVLATSTILEHIRNRFSTWVGEAVLEKVLPQPRTRIVVKRKEKTDA
jgi:hypothetical protein